MKHSEAAELLTYVAAFDRRTIGEADVIAWRQALNGLDVERCKAAIVTHYRRSTDLIMPGHIWQLARATSAADVDPALRQHCEQGTYCSDCKGVHHRHEPCNVLGQPPDNVRDITSASKRAAIGRRVPSVNAALEGQPRPARVDPQPDVTPETAEQLEAERARQLAALEAMQATS